MELLALLLLCCCLRFPVTVTSVKDESSENVEQVAKGIDSPVEAQRKVVIDEDIIKKKEADEKVKLIGKEKLESSDKKVLANL